MIYIIVMFNGQRKLSTYPQGRKKICAIRPGNSLKISTKIALL
ncbi:hypothetical protein HMPREF3227_00866 [Corynebacterium sp. CMW7794]|nr:hypothetical protein HMPREF3227_00866 [Corynebacterium sp. CMW7794]